MLCLDTRHSHRTLTALQGAVAIDGRCAATHQRVSTRAAASGLSPVCAGASNGASSWMTTCNRECRILHKPCLP